MSLFDWLKQLDPDTSGLEEMSRRFEQMLEDGRHVFDLAANALLGGTDPEVIREDLFTTDRRINRTEQDIRRKMVVHGSVYGGRHIAELLVLMSLAKDAERIGDYAKNLFDLAANDVELGDERERLVAIKDRISKVLVKTRNVYHERDEDGARAQMATCDAIQDECDLRVRELCKVEGVNAAGAALSYRYFKRITSHALNIATSLVMSVDKLDFYDEPKGS